MPITVECDACGHRMKLPDRAAGRKVACKACESAIRVPHPKRRKVAAETAPAVGDDEDDFLGGVDLRKIAAADVRVCARCGREVAEETVDCPYCGADPDTGGAGEAQLRRRSRGGYDPEKFTSTVLGDSWNFLKKNTKVAITTGTVWTIFGAFAAVCFLMRTYCVSLPPKMFWTFFGAVAVLVCLGWTWVLQLEVIRQTLAKRTKLKRVNFDMALSASSAVVMSGWAMLMGAPATIALLLPGLSLTIFGNAMGPTLLGAGAAAVAGLAALAWPGALPHVAMPNQRLAWLPPQQLAILTRTLGPRLYCVFMMFIGVAVVGAGVAGVALVAGPATAEFYEDLTHNANLDQIVANARAAAQAAQNKGQRGGGGGLKQALEAAEDKRELDFNALIIPGCAIPPLMYLAAFAFVYNTRPTALYAKLFAKQIDLDGREKEVKYVAKPKDEKADEERDKMTWVKTAVITVACPAIGLLIGFVVGNFVDTGAYENLGRGMTIGAWMLTLVALGGIGQIASEEHGVFGFSVGVLSIANFFWMINTVFGALFGIGDLIIFGLWPFAFVGVLFLVSIRWKEIGFFFVMYLIAVSLNIAGMIIWIGGLLQLPEFEEDPLLDAPPAAEAEADPE